MTQRVSGFITIFRRAYNRVWKRLYLTKSHVLKYSKTDIWILVVINVSVCSRRVLSGEQQASHPSLTVTSLTPMCLLSPSPFGRLAVHFPLGYRPAFFMLSITKFNLLRVEVGGGIGWCFGGGIGCWCFGDGTGCWCWDTAVMAVGSDTGWR